eukprot:CAMPEP_0201486404 /NCGR_PEP_ID=MMETSP0151_2-20130828/10468_1 /ASSEMBLY_ACC=CAM_ASM_000257 /TAXON_ID=200890 /ORGANISM="Paramoeba atlantica, Strain 621/1 / CCAP 1560/9" /LENGTH=565 /DNA_ID=CAMNT_0047871023 /DNA_START=253 /DNA_END=1950 /DNA_ORIENTATION=-
MADSPGDDGPNDNGGGGGGGGRDPSPKKQLRARPGAGGKTFPPPRLERQGSLRSKARQNMMMLKQSEEKEKDPKLYPVSDCEVVLLVFANTSFSGYLSKEVAKNLRNLVLYLIETKLEHCLYDEPPADSSVNDVEVKEDEEPPVSRKDVESLTLADLSPSPTFSMADFIARNPQKLFFLPKFEKIFSLYLDHFKSLHERLVEPPEGVLPYDTACEIGGRPYQEDRVSIIDFPSLIYDFPISHDFRFYCVYDGHRGCGAADVAVAFLPYVIFQLSSDPDVKLKELLVQAFEKVDEHFQRLAANRKLFSGSTVTAVLKNENRLYAANVGDSGAFLCRKSKHVSLYQKHTPDDESEKQRVKDSGGSVVWWGGGWRVNGQYGVSRSIGDLKQKKSIIATPFVTEMELTDEDEFVVIASDGLWDVLDENETIEMVYTWQEEMERKKKRREQRKEKGGEEEKETTKDEGKGDKEKKKRKKKKKPKKIAQILAAEAISRGSRDNISVIVVFLRDNQEERKNFFLNKPKKEEKKEKKKKKEKTRESSDDDSEKEKKKKKRKSSKGTKDQVKHG